MITSQDGEEDAEVAEAVCEESCERRREDEEDGDDGVDHGGLLHADAQVLQGRTKRQENIILVLRAAGRPSQF